MLSLLMLSYVVPYQDVFPKPSVLVRIHNETQCNMNDLVLARCPVCDESGGITFRASQDEDVQRCPCRLQGIICMNSAFDLRDSLKKRKESDPTLWISNSAVPAHDLNTAHRQVPRQSLSGKTLKTSGKPTVPSAAFSSVKQNLFIFCHSHSSPHSFGPLFKKCTPRADSPPACRKKEEEKNTRKEN